MVIAILSLLCLLDLVQAAPDGMDDARRLIRQGRLTQAEERLEGRGRPPDASAEASRELLLGNIAYERGDYRRARSRYLRSLELMGAVGTGPADPRLVAAHRNRDMAESRVTRQVELESVATRLRCAVGAVLSLAVLAIVALHRSSRPRSARAN